MSETVSLPRIGLAEPVASVCAILSVACLVAFGLGVLVSAALAWAMFFGPGPAISVNGPAELAAHVDATRWLWLVKLVMLTVSAMGVWAVWHAHRAFAGFARGELFTRRTMHALRGFVLAVLIAKVAPLALFIPPLITGWRPTRLSVDVGQAGGGLLDVLLVAILLVLCLVLGHAAKLAEDNAQFV